MGPESFSAAAGKRKPNWWKGKNLVSWEGLSNEPEALQALWAEEIDEVSKTES